MKIIALHIYGYGQLADVKIDNLAEFQVFFGENEAGKSTIMAFIHGILFGFPTKQQAELRYEPKHHTKYGGNIRIFHDEIGYASIERVKGKAAGDVKVILDNGTIGGEELLKELLGNLDKNLFQAVFSFNLHGLQNIHQMKGEDIGKFLFSAGTLGTDQLAKTEIWLQKELDSRFKPSGKKPVLNEKLQALHELKSELNKAAAKNKEYEELVTIRENLEQEIKQVNGILGDLQHKKEKLNEWIRIEAIVKEEKKVMKELEDLGEMQSFPARGIERLEKLTELLPPYRAQLSSLQERMKQIKHELETIDPNDSFLEAEPKLLALIDQVPIYEQLKLEKQQCETKLRELEDKLLEIRDKLHFSLSEEEIVKMNTNIHMKQQVELVAQKTKKLIEVKEELENQYQEEKEALEDLEQNIQQLENLCLPKQERILLEEQLAEGKDKQSIENELKHTREKMEFYQIAIEQQKKAAGRQKQQYILFAVILLGLTMYGVYTKQWLLTVLGVAAMVVMAVFLVQSSKSAKERNVDQQLKVLQEKEQQLIERLKAAKYLDFQKIEEQLLRDQERQEQLKLLSFQLEQQQEQFEKVIAKFEEWELQSSLNKNQLRDLSKELNIPEKMAKDFLLEAFQLIEQLKSIVREKQHLLKRLDEITRQQARIEAGLTSFVQRYLPEKGTSLQQSAYLLRNKLKEEHEKQIKRREKQAKLSELEAEWQQKNQEHEHLQMEYNRLITSANVETVQQFYELGEKSEKQTKLQERLVSLQEQLKYSILSEREREEFLQLQLDRASLSEYNQETQRLRAELKALHEKQAATNYEIQVLEEGGVYSDLLHQFKQRKYEFDQDVKDWAVLAIAQDILMKTIDTYKNVHLPKMLTKAQEFLAFLTNDRYLQIYLNPSGSGFLVESKDGTIFEANELSQATTEQLYVSIRLALVTTLYENYKLPLIIDDSFVNFDAGRTQKVMELLRRLNGNQILFFTCHAHLLPLFSKGNILSLEKGTVQIMS